jgi:hypothetical protein
MSLVPTTTIMPGAPWRRLVVIAGSILFAIAAFVFARPQRADGLPRVVVPDGGMCPNVLFDGSRLHLVYGRKGLAYYTSSSDGGRTFAPSVQLGGGKYAGDVGHERGPWVALGKDGSLHVVWMNGPEAKVFYTRSTDGGRNFSEPRNLAPRSNGVDGATLAADARGEVYVVWANTGQGPESPLSKTLMFVFSSDNGSTFSAARPLDNTYPGGACACCSVRAAMTPDRTLLVGFRGAYHNVRDIYLLHGPVQSNRFEASQVSADNWVFEGCPMAGPSVDAVTSKRIHVAWMSDGQVYHATSDDGDSFTARAAPGDPPQGPRSLPVILSNARGEQLFAWVEDQHVRWERLSPGGRMIASGNNGRLPSDSKFAAFADRDGNFVLVY